MPDNLLVLAKKAVMEAEARQAAEHTQRVGEALLRFKALMKEAGIPMEDEANVRACFPLSHSSPSVTYEAGDLLFSYESDDDGEWIELTMQNSKKQWCRTRLPKTDALAHIGRFIRYHHAALYDSIRVEGEEGEANEVG